MNTQGEPSQEKTSTRLWRLCRFLFLATALNYLDRQVLALTAEHIIEEFGLTREVWAKPSAFQGNDFN